MKLIITEKPSVGQSIGRVLGASKRCDGYLEGNGYLVSWCVGHLVELAQPEAYDEVEPQRPPHPAGALAVPGDGSDKKAVRYPENADAAR